MAESSKRPAGPSTPVHHDNHGNSPAAWTAVGIVLLGSAVCSAAVIWPTLWLFVVGVVIIVAGAVTGKVMSAMGMGSDAHEQSPSSPVQGTR